MGSPEMGGRQNGPQAYDGSSPKAVFLIEGSPHIPLIGSSQAACKQVSVTEDDSDAACFRPCENYG